MEIVNLPKKKFKVMIVKMIREWEEEWINRKIKSF